MSVLNCPVCQGAMREVNRNGVLIDTCTQCRGVWLDRGELEKLASVVGEPSSGFLANGAPMRPRDDHRRYDDDDDDRKYRYGKSEKRRSFLDFFD